MFPAWRIPLVYALMGLPARQADSFTNVQKTTRIHNPLTTSRIRPAKLRQEIFELLFDAANIATFAPEDKIKYEYAMTTERDIRNQIRYAEKKGMEKGIEKGTEQIARRMLDGKMPIEKIIEFTGLTEEQVRAL